MNKSLFLELILILLLAGIFVLLLYLGKTETEEKAVVLIIDASSFEKTVSSTQFLEVLNKPEVKKAKAVIFAYKENYNEILFLEQKVRERLGEKILICFFPGLESSLDLAIILLKNKEIFPQVKKGVIFVFTDRLFVGQPKEYSPEIEIVLRPFPPPVY